MEKPCNLWMVAATSDNSQSDVYYQTKKLYAKKQFICCVSDPPLLVKTTINCLYYSGDGKQARYMGSGWKYLLWQHIAHMYFMDAESPLKVLPKTTYDHISLTPYLVMRVDLEAQILRSTMASVLTHHGGNELSGITKYYDMTDQYFDCMNVRSVSEHSRKDNDKVVPYIDIDDERFTGYLMCF